MRLILAALTALALPAAAQELPSQFEVIDRMDVTVDGTPMVLPIAVDTKSGNSYATIKEFFGQKVLSVMAVTPVEVGGWDAPTVTLTIRVRAPDRGDLGAIEMSEKGRSLSKLTQADLANGSMAMPEFSISEDGAVELSFSSELIRLVYDAEYKATPEEGQPPVVISGTVSMVIPEEFR